MTTLDRLQRWYAAQCDGDWEHQQGIKIITLDNPGWRVVINLLGTPIETATFAEVSNLGPEDHWIRCWVEGGEFNGAGGSLMLEAILEHFLPWAEGVSAA